MRLINVDTLDNYLGKWADDFYENPENSDADFMDGYCMTMNHIQSSAVPTVDAIPIEWIEKYVESKTALLGDSELWMKWMIDDWQKEQEKQNDDN